MRGLARASRPARLPRAFLRSPRLTAAHFKYATDAARFIVDPDVRARAAVPADAVHRRRSLLNVAGVDVSTTVPVQFRSEGDIFSGEKRSEMHVVPKFAVSAVAGHRASCRSARRRRRRRGTERDVRVTVTNHSPGAAKAEVQLDLPQAWKATPATAPVSFTREDEAITVRFKVMVPPAPMRRRRATHHGEGASSGRRDDVYAQGYQVVEYPHTTRRHVLRAPEVDRQGPRRQGEAEPHGRLRDGRRRRDPAGARAAWREGRAAERGRARVGRSQSLRRRDDRRARLRAARRSARLQPAAARLRARPAARSSSTTTSSSSTRRSTARIPARSGASASPTRTRSVRVLQPQNPVFTTPNKIGDADWKGWRQERGLYFFDAAPPADRRSGRVRRAVPVQQGPEARRAGRSQGRHRDGGSTSASGSGGSCRPAPTAPTG